MHYELRVDAAALDELFAPFDTTNAPGFAVGVALGGVPRYRRGFGLANIELPVALSPSIRMRIGSTTKHFTVLATMLLQEEGRLSIDDSPRKVLPELQALADKVTIRQLMAHTSGLRDSLDLLFLAAGDGRPAEPDANFKLMSKLDSVNFAPGASWNYNNGGYVLLTVIIERLSGQSFGEFLRTRIFEPIGMTDTVLRLWDTELLPNSATLHVPNVNGGWRRGIFGPPITGEGGIASTVDDMLLWLKHMSAPIVGSTETWSAMRTPQSTHGYGLGLIMGEHRGLRTVSHAGGYIGGSNQMLKVIDGELDLILFTNGQSVLDMYRLVDDIIDRCIPGLPPAPQDVGGAPITGTFYSRASGRTLRLGDDGKQVTSIGHMTLPTIRDTEGQMSIPLLAPTSDLRLAPIYQSERVVALEATEFGKLDRLDRVTVPDDASLDAHQGMFTSAAAGLSARLEGNTMTLVGPWGTLDYALASAGPDLWQGLSNSAVPIGISIEFDERGFQLTTGRTIRLRFERVE